MNSVTPTQSYCCPCVENICDTLQSCYTKVLVAIVEFFRYFGPCVLVGFVLTAILAEPITCLRVLYNLVFGENTNTNPTEITAEQSHKHAILLIHGNFHNDTAWVGLTPELQAAGLGPVYTPENLPSGPITSRDYTLIAQKITEIRRQYLRHGRDPVIDIVGHSRGAGILCKLLSRSEISPYRNNIGKLIRMGDPDFPLENGGARTPYIINGLRDHLVMANTPQSLHPTPRDSACYVNSAHFGLLYDPQAHAHITLWLRSSA